MKQKEYERFLIVRTDRIGDVILTLPVAAAIKERFSNAHITLLCRRETAVIGERNPAVDSVLTIDSNEGHRRSFFELVSLIRKSHFDCAVVVHPEFRQALLLILAGIPVRVGTGFRFYSMLFNRRHYEHRKKSVKHEVDYNLSLLSALNAGAPGQIEWSAVTPKFQFDLHKEDRDKAAEALKEIGISLGEPYCVIHPGSGGSAMDWPLDYYAAAGDLFVQELHLPVVVSWGSLEKQLAEELQHLSENDLHTLPDVLPLSALAVLLQNAAFLLAPSTGVLHLAHMVGTPVIGLYPPVRHESPVRWGPYGRIEYTFMPNREDCPTCKGKKCRKLNCMELIKPAVILEAAQKIIGINSVKKKQNAGGKSIQS